MKCLAVELKGSQWAFYLIVGLLAIVFLIMNVLCLEFGIKKATVDRLFKRNGR